MIALRHITLGRAAIKAAFSHALLGAIFLSCQIVVSAKVEASQKFQYSNEDYVNSAFKDETYSAERVWIKGTLRDQIEKILRHRSTFIRSKYWINEKKSVWILGEIGKDHPITVGITIEHHKNTSSILDVKVLAFRENRGWEVKYPFFTDQYKKVKRKQNHRGLDTTIDGITGATLSVRALNKLAEIALLLDEHVRKTQKFTE